MWKTIRYSIGKRLAFIKKNRIWAKYGDRTEYHLTDPNFSIGEFTYGVPQVCRYDTCTKLSIGKFCSLAADVRILLGGAHNVKNISTFPFYKEEKIFNYTGGNDVYKGDVVIGNDVWIGRGALILSGVTIGDGAVIGAGCVVAKDIPPYAIVVGNPAQIIRYRFSDFQIKALLQIEWWNWNVEKIKAHAQMICSENIDEFISLVLGEDWTTKI